MHKSEPVDCLCPARHPQLSEKMAYSGGSAAVAGKGAASLTEVLCPRAAAKIPSSTPAHGAIGVHAAPACLHQTHHQCCIQHGETHAGKHLLHALLETCMCTEISPVYKGSLRSWGVTTEQVSSSNSSSRVNSFYVSWPAGAVSSGGIRCLPRQPPSAF